MAVENNFLQELEKDNFFEKTASEKEEIHSTLETITSDVLEKIAYEIGAISSSASMVTPSLEEKLASECEEEKKEDKEKEAEDETSEEKEDEKKEAEDETSEEKKEENKEDKEKEAESETSEEKEDEKKETESETSEEKEDEKKEAGCEGSEEKEDKEKEAEDDEEEKTASKIVNNVSKKILGKDLVTKSNNYSAVKALIGKPDKANPARQAYEKALKKRALQAGAVGGTVGGGAGALAAMKNKKKEDEIVKQAYELASEKLANQNISLTDYIYEKTANEELSNFIADKAEKLAYLSSKPSLMVADEILDSVANKLG